MPEQIRGVSGVDENSLETNIGIVILEPYSSDTISHDIKIVLGSARVYGKEVSHGIHIQVNGEWENSLPVNKAPISNSKVSVFIHQQLFCYKI